MTNTQADNLIESGLPLKEVIPLFHSRVAAYEYFARRMAQSHAASDSHCCMCGRDCQEPPLSFTWRANLHTTKTVVLSPLFTALALFAHHLYSRWVVVEFTTFHRLCQQCQRRHRTRSVLVSLSHKLLFAVLILLLCLTVPVVVFLFVMPFVAPETVRLFLPASVIGIGLIALVAWGFDTCRKSLIPHSLRQIGRFPFFLYALRKAASYEGSSGKD